MSYVSIRVGKASQARDALIHVEYYVKNSQGQLVVKCIGDNAKTFTDKASAFEWVLKQLGSRGSVHTHGARVVYLTPMKDDRTKVWISYELDLAIRKRGYNVVCQEK